MRSLKELFQMPARKTRDTLPDCTCDAPGSSLMGASVCRVHGLLEKERTQRTARREIQAGNVTQQQFDDWRKNHFPPKKRKWTEG